VSSSSSLTLSWGLIRHWWSTSRVCHNLDRGGGGQGQGGGEGDKKLLGVARGKSLVGTRVCVCVWWGRGRGGVYVCWECVRCYRGSVCVDYVQLASWEGA